MKRLPLLLALLVSGCDDKMLSGVVAPEIPSVASESAVVDTSTEAVFEPTPCRAPFASTAHGRVDIVVQSNDDYAFAVEKYDSDADAPLLYHELNFHKERGGLYQTWPHEGGRYRFAILCGDKQSMYSNWVFLEHGSGAPSRPTPSGPGGPTLVAYAETSHTFVANNPSARDRLVDLSSPVPAGSYTLKLIPKDEGPHHPTQGQKKEQILGIVNGVVCGPTPDIPEDAASVTHTCPLTLSMTARNILLKHAADLSDGPQSVHGVRVEVWK